MKDTITKEQVELVIKGWIQRTCALGEKGFNHETSEWHPDAEGDFREHQALMSCRQQLLDLFQPVGHQEADIIVNGVYLTQAQSMTIRVALGGFAMELQDRGLGDDKHGVEMTAVYLEAIRGINKLTRIKL